MRQIAIICAFFLVILVAVVGLMIIFDMMSFDTGLSMMLRFGAAIVLLGACSALISYLMGRKDDAGG